MQEIEQLVQQPAGRRYKSQQYYFTRLAVMCYTILLAIAWLWMSLREAQWLPHKYLLGQIHWAWQMLWGIFFATFFIGVSLLAHQLCAWVRRAEEDLQHLLGHLSPLQIWLLAFFSSIGEEAFFRAALQPSLGLWLASLLFGLAHIPPTRRLWFYPLVAAATGCGLGWLYFGSGYGLLPPIVAHFVINLVGLYRLSRMAVDNAAPSL